jgi:hypothetical protein
MDTKSFFGEDFLNIFRPLYEAQVSGIDIFKESYIKGLCNLVDTVKVKVENALAVGAAIFVDNRKARRTYGIVSHPKRFANSRNESGFTGPHGSIKSHYPALPEGFEELLRCGIDP